MLLLQCYRPVPEEDRKLPKDFDFLKKAHTVLEFAELTTAAMAVFIKKEAAKRNMKLSGVTINDLIRANMSNSWGIINDLDKLELGGTLDEHVAAQNFWALINKAKSGDIAALTWLLENEKPAMVFNMISSGTEPALKTKMADLDVAIKRGKLDYEEALLAATLGD